MLWVTSILVLHPNTVMEMDGPLGGLVRVAAGIGVSVSVDMTTVVVGVAGILVTPITTGVGVNMDGVGVEGRNGVGPGSGWMIQPLQDVNIHANRIGRISFFIFSPLLLFYPSCEVKQSPPMGLFWNCYEYGADFRQIPLHTGP